MPRSSRTFPFRRLFQPSRKTIDIPPKNNPVISAPGGVRRSLCFGVGTSLLGTHVNRHSLRLQTSEVPNFLAHSKPSAQVDFQGNSTKLRQSVFFSSFPFLFLTCLHSFLYCMAFSAAKSSTSRIWILIVFFMGPYD
jgi:hypothetical protein